MRIEHGTGGAKGMTIMAPTVTVVSGPHAMAIFKSAERSAVKVR
jgi:hypothetical protein